MPNVEPKMLAEVQNWLKQGLALRQSLEARLQALREEVAELEGVLASLPAEASGPEVDAPPVVVETLSTLISRLLAGTTGLTSQQIALRLHDEGKPADPAVVRTVLYRMKRRKQVVAIETSGSAPLYALSPSAQIREHLVGRAHQRAGRTSFLALEFFRDHPEGVYTTQQVAAALNAENMDLIRSVLGRLAERGNIERVDDGKYRFVTASDNTSSVAPDTKGVA